jgi:hypothetical protein
VSDNYTQAEYLAAGKPKGYEWDDGIWMWVPVRASGGSAPGPAADAMELATELIAARQAVRDEMAAFALRGELRFNNQAASWSRYEKARQAWDELPNRLAAVRATEPPANGRTPLFVCICGCGRRYPFDESASIPERCECGVILRPTEPGGSQPNGM